MEKIRAKGSADSYFNRYAQRRLVFQRRLSNKKIIDEDFFNLNLTVLMPDWPARFQIERFRDYVTDLIQERLPSHISSDILMVNATGMKAFEEKYHHWQNLRLKSRSPEKNQKEVQKAALDVYDTIMSLKKK
jgi:hypothetical protein